MSKKPKEQATDVATPSSFPIIKSIAFQRVPGGWTVIEVTTQGDKVLSIEATEPDVRAIAQETFRRKAGQIMMDQT